jgi:hypothetical protein
MRVLEPGDSSILRIEKPLDLKGNPGPAVVKQQRVIPYGMVY